MLACSKAVRICCGRGWSLLVVTNSQLSAIERKLFPSMITCEQHFGDCGSHTKLGVPSGDGYPLESDISGGWNRSAGKAPARQQPGQMT